MFRFMLFRRIRAISPLMKDREVKWLEHKDADQNGYCDTCGGEMELAICRPKFGEDCVVIRQEDTVGRCAERGEYLLLTRPWLMTDFYFRYPYRAHWFGVGDIDWYTDTVIFMFVFDDNHKMGSYSFCLIGDLDNDIKITAADARVALRCSVGLEPDLDLKRKLAADVDFDSRISAADAREILRAAVGLVQPEQWFPDEG